MQRRLRLRHREDFRRLRSTGQTWAHPLLVLSIAPNQLPHNRYGVITARKLGGAVARNRVKRRIREAARHLHARIVPGYDLVFIARPRISECAYTELLEAMERLLQRAGVM
jgi:ribonuclease P protein component